MKRIISFVCLSFIFAVLSAQSIQNRVAEIRQAYNEAQQMMQMAQEEPNVDNSMHITMRRMFGGSGMQIYTIDYYSGDYSEEEEYEGVSTWSPYFIRVKYNWAARVTVSEYLLDPRTSRLMFVYTRSDDNPFESQLLEDGNYEVRKYYYSDGTYCTGTAKRVLPDGTFYSLDSELAKQYKAFETDVDEVRFVDYLVTIHNQMMNYEQ